MRVVVVRAGGDLSSVGWLLGCLFRCLVVLTLLISLIMELNRYRNCATMCWLVFEKRRRREEPSEGD